ncbi:hypothetical protein BD311DRAFT_631380, partial [Dichomitus squalens]
SSTDTFVHVTDLSGKETISRVTGAFPSYPMFSEVIIMRSYSLASPYAAILAARRREVGITVLH